VQTVFLRRAEGRLALAQFRLGARPLRVVDESLELVIGDDEARQLDRLAPRADRLPQARFNRLLHVVGAQGAACLVEQLLVDRDRALHRHQYDYKLLVGRAMSMPDSAPELDTLRKEGLLR
jgi:hypothetical protein